MIIARETTEHGEVVLRTGIVGYEIIVDGQFLMSSASGPSSEVLVEAGLQSLPPDRKCSVTHCRTGTGLFLTDRVGKPSGRPGGGRGD